MEKRLLIVTPLRVGVLTEDRSIVIQVEAPPELGLAGNVHLAFRLTAEETIQLAAQLLEKAQMVVSAPQPPPPK